MPLKQYIADVKKTATLAMEVQRKKVIKLNFILEFKK